QTVSSITAMILDKTGTITLGAPKVTDIEPVESWTQEDLLRLVASVEQGSEHPLAQAIVESATERNLVLSPVSHFQAIAGQGAEGSVEGKTVALGNRKLMNEKHIN